MHFDLQFLRPHLFSAGILALGAWVMWRVRRSLVTGEREGKQVLTDRKSIMAVPHPSGDTRPTDEAKRRGVRSIEARFTVHRRLLMPLVGLATLALASLPFLGDVPATALSLVVAIVTGVLGVAARPVLENAISGLVLSFSKAIRIGDTVTLDDLYGTIEDISSTHTTIRIWDWRRYVVPNSEMLQSKVVNYTLFDQQLWACVEFWVAHDTDLARLQEIALEVARESRYALDSEQPELWFLALEQLSLKCWLVAWTANSAAAWAFKDEVRGKLATRLHQEGIHSHGYRQLVSRPGGRPEAPVPG